MNGYLDGLTTDCMAEAEGERFILVLSRAGPLTQILIFQTFMIMSYLTVFFPNSSLTA